MITFDVDTAISDAQLPFGVNRPWGELRLTDADHARITRGLYKLRDSLQLDAESANKLIGIAGFSTHGFYLRSGAERRAFLRICESLGLTRNNVSN